MTTNYNTQNDLLLSKLITFYNIGDNLEKILPIINGESKISLRLIDWFVTNYSKFKFTVINNRFKVYNEYKLQLRAYQKKRFDPFCRWERVNIPFGDEHIQTTIGQLNFFKWILENNIIDYIINNERDIEEDMNKRNSLAKRKNNTTRKKREELSISASKSIKKEYVQIEVNFK